MAHPTARPHATSRTVPPAPRRWQALAVLCLAQFMVILDVTVVNIALPAIGADLDLDRSAATWVVTAYTLCFGGLMLLGGRLADLYGRRRVFLAGLALFTLASLVAGLTGSGPMLIAARAVQGAGAALLSPSALSIVTTTFHGPERHRALGVWAAIGGGGAAAGVLLGGVLTSGPGWPWVFFVNVPVGLLVAVALPRLVAAGPAARGGRLDLPGAALVTAATALVVYGLLRAGDAGWSDRWTLAALGGGLVLAAVFAVVERRAQAPLVRLGLLTRRPVITGNLVMLAASGLLLAAFFLTSQYLQQVAGLPALETGLAFLPVAVATVVGAHLGSRLVVRVGGRIVAASAFACTAAGMALLSRLPVRPDVLTDVEPGFVLAALGLGAAFVTATTTAMTHVAHEEAGVVSGLVNTGHELGAGLGVAAFSTLAATGIGAAQAGGFADAYRAAAIGAAVTAVAAAAALPKGRPPAGDGPIFVH
ncbi:MFS transporter [Planomonospora sphaerica]|uniref:MFS transporter n=1 Tax=Planomonospora sphaerica TaxID=161355 RepID=A0A171DPL0_9ACTN|nr:MFS transporter [Planomonospora sphaerica]GAT70990.1 MFS transporter [Planomonospora sphaerica]